MATETIVRLIDDLDGTDATTTIEFGIDGQTFEIDLNDDNAEKLRDALAEFVAAARKAQPARKTRQTAPKTSSDTAEAREWLKTNGYDVKDKGRVPQDLLEVWWQNKDLPVVDDAPQEPEEEEAPELPPVDESDDAVMAWWTGVAKYREPKNRKVNAIMRNKYKAAMVKARGAA